MQVFICAHLCFVTSIQSVGSITHPFSQGWRVQSKALRQGQGRAGRGQERSKRERKGKNSLTRGKLTRELWTVCVCVCVCVCLCVRERETESTCVCVCVPKASFLSASHLILLYVLPALLFCSTFFYSLTWGCIHKKLWTPLSFNKKKMIQRICSIPQIS